jgi:hypothetical protein
VLSPCEHYTRFEAVRGFWNRQSLPPQKNELSRTPRGRAPPQWAGWHRTILSRGVPTLISALSAPVDIRLTPPRLPRIGPPFLRVRPRLNQACVRGAIRTLEAIGLLERAIPPSGSRYKAIEGRLHRKPILFVFGSEFAPAFMAANRRARAVRDGDLWARQPYPPATAPCLSTAFPETRRTNSPKKGCRQSRGHPAWNKGQALMPPRSW